MNHRGTEAQRRLRRLWFLISCIGAFVFCVLAPTASAQRQAQLSWWDRAPESKFGHYWIKSDLPAEQVRDIAQHLNLMYGQYARLLAFVPVRVEEQLNVLAFASEQDYQLTLRARFGVNATASGGMFFVTSAGTALAFFTEGLPRQRLRHVIQHEGFHQFAYSRFGDDLPPWANEGLAEFFGQAIIVGDTMTMGQCNPRVLNLLQRSVDSGAAIPMTRMLSLTSRTWTDNLRNGEAAQYYAQAWSMVQFLVYGENGAHATAFDTYLKHVNNGLPAGEAFSRALGADTADFEARWKRWVLSAQPSAFVSAMERIEFLTEGSLELNRRGIRPASLDELKRALQELNFEYAMMSHGMKATLKATDDSMFEIPRDALCRDQPVFAVDRPRLGALPLRMRKLEEAHPSPSRITTAHLGPRNLAVRWIRGQDGETSGYEIEIR